AVAHPGLAVPLGAAPEVAAVGPRARPGHGERAEKLALGHAGEIAAFLLLVHGARADQPVAPGDDRGDAHPGAGELLGDQAILEYAQSEPAVLLGDDDAEISHFGELVAKAHGDLALLGAEFIGE